MKKTNLLFSIVSLVAISYGTQVWAAKTIPLNLDSIVKSAEVIFEGECVEYKTGKDPQSGLIATWYTFRVTNAIKGKLDEETTFKLYGGHGEPDQSLLVPTTHFHEGEAMILFLYGKSELGFTSPVGLHQGKFSIHIDDEGNPKIVSNGMPASVLFNDMEDSIPMRDSAGFQVRGMASQHLKTMAKSDFISFVKTLVKQDSLREQ